MFFSIIIGYTIKPVPWKACPYFYLRPYLVFFFR
nr:MAG TPA: hypothetical protein [Caudoviricetes sp.]